MRAKVLRSVEFAVRTIYRNRKRTESELFDVLVFKIIDHASEMPVAVEKLIHHASAFGCLG
jgi:hypothetical protein